MPNGTEQYIRYNQQQNTFETRKTVQNQENDYVKKMEEFNQRNQELSSSQRTVLGFKKKDSQEMQDIKDGLSTLSTYLSTQTISIREDAFEAQLQNVKEYYDSLINSCTRYVSSKNPYTSSGKARLALVKRVLSQAQKERELLYASAHAIFEHASEEQDASISWLNILGDIRSPLINIDRLETEEVGNGTSHVWKFSQGSENVYFKPTEKRPSSNYSVVLDQCIRQHATEESPMKTAFDSLRSINVVDLEPFIEYMATVDVRHPLKPADLTSQDPHTRQAAEQILQQLLKSADYLFVYPARLRSVAYFHSPEGFAALYELAKDTSKSSTLAFVSGKAGIDEGSLISTRNVATSRVASLLGVSDLFAKSRTVVVEKSGEKIAGNLMIEAHGAAFHQLMTEAQDQNIPTSYSPETIRQLTILQIMDSLCGQYDRNLSNFLCQYQENNGQRIMTGLTAIDNDIAFGKLGFQQIKSNGKAFRSLLVSSESETCSLPAIDREFYENFKSLTPEILEFSLSDLLSRQELDALNDRLQGIKDILEKNITANPDFLVDREGWNDAARRFASATLAKTYIKGDFVR